MALNNDTAQREALKRAMRIAEIRVEDAEDMNECVSDLVRSAGLDEDSAKDFYVRLRQDPKNTIV